MKCPHKNLKIVKNVVKNRAEGTAFLVTVERCKKCKKNINVLSEKQIR